MAQWFCDGYILSPLPGECSAFMIIFQDTKGFFQSNSTFKDPDLHYRGIITIENYTNSGCWCHCWCRWTFFVISPLGPAILQLDLWVDFYTGIEHERPKGAVGRWGLSYEIMLY